MLIPRYWAEARIQRRVEDRQVTVRRFGWSNLTQADAQSTAETRAEQALTRILDGEDLPRRELKRAYNGGEGVPIREEIIRDYGLAVTTRNNYGAVCLNTPNVLFVDIDFLSAPGCPLVLACLALLQGVTYGLWQLTGSKGWTTMFGIATLILAPILAISLNQLRISLMGGEARIARRRIERFIAKHPDWHLRLYRTPAGLRVLALHQTFDPNDPEVTACFRALRADPLYVTMCQKQQCFRARVSPKPWRIGKSLSMMPRGIWPTPPENMPARQKWIEEYETAAVGYASCEYVEDLGSSSVDRTAEAVRTIHDELCWATSRFPIA